jgi:aryl-alcohol dehydrogenase-like predicted oxidoreductase
MFSGVPFAVGLAAVERLRSLVSGDATMAQWALRWVLMEESVTCAIPGARSVAQAPENAAAADLSPFSESDMAAVGAVYDRRSPRHRARAVVK